MTALPLAATRADAPSASPTRTLLLLACAAFALALGLLAWRGVPRLNIPGAPDAAHWALADFRDAVYYPAVAFLAGANPYDRQAYRAAYPIGLAFPLYAPHTILVHLPFGLLPYEAAEAVYVLFVIALTLVLAALALEAGGIPRTAAGVLVIAALLLLSRPGHMNLLLGQVTVQVVIGTWLALRWAESRPGLAAFGLAVSLLKPTFGIPLVVLLCCRGAWRTVTGGIVLAGLASLAVTARLVVAAGGAAPFLASITENLVTLESGVMANPATSPFRIDAAGVVGRILGWDAVGLPITFGVLAVAGLSLARLRGEPLGDREVAWTLPCTAILACAYHQAYDLLLLVPPAVALAAGRTRTVTRHALLALLLLPMANYLATDTAVRTLGLDGRVWIAAASLNGLAVMSAFLLCVALAWRRVPA